MIHSVDGKHETLKKFLLYKDDGCIEKYIWRTQGEVWGAGDGLKNVICDSYTFNFSKLRSHLLRFCLRLIIFLNVSWPPPPSRPPGYVPLDH